MSTPLLIPTEGFGHHGPHLGDGPPPFAPFLGATMFLLFLLIVAATIFLMRRGTLGAPPWLAAHRSPESEAKKVLAERFARGDISSDEFLERASVLNWTPGSDAWETRKKHRR